MDEPPKNADPYPARGKGYYKGPPVQAPLQYRGAPPPRRKTGFLEECLAALSDCCPINECCCCCPIDGCCCCCPIDECCCDPFFCFEFC